MILLVLRTTLCTQKRKYRKNVNGHTIGIEQRKPVNRKDAKRTQVAQGPHAEQYREYLYFRIFLPRRTYNKLFNPISNLNRTAAVVR